MRGIGGHSRTKNCLKPIFLYNLFFFLIGKDNSLRAKRLEKGYTRGIPRYKEAKKQKDKQADPFFVTLCCGLECT